jgi:hypothetical protein
MPYMDFYLLQDLSPAAFKLYAYFLHLVQSKNVAAFSLALVKLGYDSGLQPSCPYPAFRHGKDRQLRNAIEELINKGWLEKCGQRGRAPNTYTVLKHHLHENPDDERSLALNPL